MGGRPLIIQQQPMVVVNIPNGLLSIGNLYRGL